MKIKLLVITLFAGSMLFTSCSKEDYFGPVDATGQPMNMTTRGGEEGDNTTNPEGGSDGITDSGHDSDYDNSNKKRKQ